MDDERALELIKTWLTDQAKLELEATQLEVVLDESLQRMNTQLFRIREDGLRSKLRMIRELASAIGEHELAEDMIEFDHPYEGPWHGARRAVADLRGVIRNREELAAILGPVGPQLNASALHPVIWGAAANLWDDGHLRQAVQTAGSALESYLQRAGTYASGQDLGQLFALTDPTLAVPRLRIDGIEPESQTWTSAHNGAAMLVRGAMMAVRNRVSHEGWPDPEPGPDEALEMLAIFSYVARLVDMSYVHEASNEALN